MRPAGDVRLALVTAAHQLQPREPHGPRPTLREIAHHAQVGIDAATVTMKNLCRAKQMRAIPDARKVDYRNKPVAVYEPISASLDQAGGHSQAFVDLGRIVGTWTR